MLCETFFNSDPARPECYVLLHTDPTKLPVPLLAGDKPSSAPFAGQQKNFKLSSANGANNLIRFVKNVRQIDFLLGELGFSRIPSKLPTPFAGEGAQKTSSFQDIVKPSRDT